MHADKVPPMSRPDATRRPVREHFLDLPFTVRERLSKSQRLQDLLYEFRNRRTFSDLFQHDRMLADEVRIDAYWRGLTKHIETGDVVVDLGAGTGVLSMLAAKSAKRVHAIEHGPIIEAAEAVAAANGFTNIEFHRMNSRRFELAEKADAIIHEQLGDALFDEKVVENIADLRRRVLKPGGRIYPSKLRLYIEPIQLQEDMRSPFAWQQNLHGIDFSAIERFATISHPYLYRLFRPMPFGHFLCSPAPVLSVDLESAEAGDLPRRISYERIVETAGFFDGFCVYFDAGFDDEVTFTTSPDARGTSWGTPFMRVAPRSVEPGDRIDLELTAEDLATPATWTWNWAGKAR